MAAGKRVADAPPGAPPKHTEKKQKTAPGGQSVPTASALLKTPAPKAHAEKTHTKSKAQKAQHIVPIRPETARSGFTVVPATPGTIVDLEAAAKEAAAKETQPKEPKKKAPPPTTLPLEPHAAILADLQHKYAVRVLSVISSTRMEKRIKAVLEHLGGSDGKPGVVLLHARAPDANKLVSIAEIIKRRIREGYFAGADKAAKPKSKNKNKKKDAAAVAWYQYDRIYDVKTAKAAGDDDTDGEAADEQMDRLAAALTDEAAPASRITTYMSIMLSRTPVGELHKHADVTVQCSTDPLEVEYEQYMAA